MGRAPKKGLSYYPKTVDYYSDDKIMDLSDEYGPIGLTVYDVILTLIYTNGYYLEIPMDKLARIVRRTIGNRWIRDINLVIQVIDYCADIDLFNLSLLQQNIITSEGIQRRYAEVTARNKVDKSKYWLLGVREASEDDAKKDISATEKDISATEKPINTTEIPQNKTKQNENKLNKYSSSCCIESANEKNFDNDKNVQNYVENFEIDIEENVSAFSMLSIEAGTTLIKSCDKLIYKYWCRSACKHDYEAAAEALYILFFKNKKPFKELTEEHMELLETAIQISADADAKRWGYVKGIFRNWGNANVFDLASLAEYDMKRRR